MEQYTALLTFFITEDDDVDGRPDAARFVAKLPFEVLETVRALRRASRQHPGRSHHHGEPTQPPIRTSDVRARPVVNGHDRDPGIVADPCSARMWAGPDRAHAAAAGPIGDLHCDWAEKAT